MRTQRLQPVYKLYPRKPFAVHIYLVTKQLRQGPLIYVALNLGALYWPNGWSLLSASFVEMSMVVSLNPYI